MQSHEQRNNKEHSLLTLNCTSPSASITLRISVRSSGCTWVLSISPSWRRISLTPNRLPRRSTNNSFKLEARFSSNSRSAVLRPVVILILFSFCICSNLSVRERHCKYRYIYIIIQQRSNSHVHILYCSYFVAFACVCERDCKYIICIYINQ